MVHLLLLKLLQHQFAGELFDLEVVGQALGLRTLPVALVKNLIVAFSADD